MFKKFLIGALLVLFCFMPTLGMAVETCSVLPGTVIVRMAGDVPQMAFELPAPVISVEILGVVEDEKLIKFINESLPGDWTGAKFVLFLYDCPTHGLEEQTLVVRAEDLKDCK